MTTERWLSIAAGLGATMVLLMVALAVPLQVRNSAPFGFTLTVDFKRGIAVRGGLVPVNYPNFDRLDLDLRAYERRSQYDITVHVREEGSRGADLRAVALRLPGTRIRHDKPAFANPFTTVRFPPIKNSAGRTYYVYVERGPRNTDDVLTLWSIKSYSRTTGRVVLGAFLDQNPTFGGGAGVRTLIVFLLLAFVASCGWLMAEATFLALHRAAGFANVQPSVRRWHTPAADGIQ